MEAPETLRQPFTDPDWLYELKFDGYRCMAGIEKAPAEPPQTRLQLATDSVVRVRLLTKSGSDCTLWFPEIAEALVALPGGPHVIDGEVCVMRPDGTSDFNLLQARARRRKPYPGGPQVTLLAFDLLVHDGQSVMGRALVERKGAARAAADLGAVRHGPAGRRQRIPGHGRRRRADRGVDGQAKGQHLPAGRAIDRLAEDQAAGVAGRPSLAELTHTRRHLLLSRGPV
jgi:hypothetical protein